MKKPKYHAVDVHYDEKPKKSYDNEKEYEFFIRFSSKNYEAIEMVSIFVMEFIKIVDKFIEKCIVKKEKK